MPARRARMRSRRSPTRDQAAVAALLSETWIIGVRIERSAAVSGRWSAARMSR